LKKRPKQCPEEISREEKRTTAIGLCLQAQSYLQSAEYLMRASRSGDLSLRFNSPAVFLLAHGVELTFKAWLRKNGKTLQELKSLSHDLVKAYRECKLLELPIEEDSMLLEWASTRSELHLTDEAVISEVERVRKIPVEIRKFGLQRQLLLLSKLHDGRYVLRYHRSDLYKYPDIELALFFVNKLCKAIEPECQRQYEESGARS
jgi:hypothetical protein